MGPHIVENKLQFDKKNSKNWKVEKTWNFFKQSISSIKFKRYKLIGLNIFFDPQLEVSEASQHLEKILPQNKEEETRQLQEIKKKLGEKKFRSHLEKKLSMGTFSINFSEQQINLFDCNEMTQRITKFEQLYKPIKLLRKLAVSKPLNSIVFNKNQ